MSWSGFKKNVGRATTQVMMKTGQVEKTADRAYEVEERRYRTLEAASTRLQKEAKGYLDSLRAMTASQMRIAETIDAFYGDSGARDGVSRSYKQAVEDLDAETVKALDGPYRCVPESLYRYAEDERTIREIEEEWNFKAGNRRVFTRGKCAGAVELDKEDGLMDYLYRSTVLEPINRFCAYFPDINECIKKRQHKMLDYDSMRSKVKRLTEKPDKDPGKLPRTEKETEMVSLQRFLDDDSSCTSTAQHTRAASEPYQEEVDLGIPSPPKALQRPEIWKLRGGERRPLRTTSLDLSPRSKALNRGFSMTSPQRSADVEGAALERSPLMAARTTTGSDSDSALNAEPETVSLISFLQASRLPPSTASRSTSMPPASSPLLPSTPTPSSIHRPPPHPSIRLPSTPQHPPHPSIRPPTTPSTRSISSRRGTPTPFFQPSELEDIMAPFKQEFLQKQTDEWQQAKQAYEQLNEQLTNELPQLIDLRVPYLDPTFEALVKIQLRFCAEAYSRMAQVQQYLDASTRDQYAAGELDARVEDVLGQIRELSIAGTV